MFTFNTLYANTWQNERWKVCTTVQQEVGSDAPIVYSTINIYRHNGKRWVRTNQNIPKYVQEYVGLERSKVEFYKKKYRRSEYEV